MAVSSGTNGKIYFRGEFAGNALFTTYTNTNAWATSAPKMKLSGNLNTLLNYTSPPTTVGAYCYAYMFFRCSALVDISELTLPATTLAEKCYSSMFDGCSRLVTAPVLPATTLAGSCYAGMFEMCTQLVTAPDLPATTLVYNCYEWMFMDCTSLQRIAIKSTDTTPSFYDETLARAGTGGTIYTDNESQPALPAGWTRQPWASRPQ